MELMKTTDEIYIDKLIDWSEISRILVGTRSVISKNRMPKKHIKRVDELRQKNQEWYDSLDPSEIKNKQ